jgi:hypothetical protein
MVSPVGAMTPRLVVKLLVADRRQGGMMGVEAKRDLVQLAIAPSQTERDKAARTHTVIRQHLETDPALKKYKIDTFLQGSYKNSTNVRGDSDVDLGSETNEVFYHDTDWLPTEPRYEYGVAANSLKESVDQSLSQLGTGGFTFWQYRADVLASLQREYGADSVVDGNKAITVTGNTSRLDADVLACTSFRQYYKDWQGKASYHKGIAFFSKSHERIVNFPKQHFDNLSEKDLRNAGKVKGCIRILKRIRNEFEDQGEWDRKRSPSFYLESFVWNAPDDKFNGGYASVVQNVLAYLYNDVKEKKAKNELNSYAQANNIFTLFHPKFWNADDALAFIDKIWEAVFRVTS